MIYKDAVIMHESAKYLVSWVNMDAGMIIQSSRKKGGVYQKGLWLPPENHRYDEAEEVFRYKYKLPACKYSTASEKADLLCRALLREFKKELAAYDAPRRLLARL